MNSRTYYIYILASDRNGTLYTGVTNDLLRRVYEHKKKIQKSFASRYNVNMLVYFEQTDDINAAISREKNKRNGTATGRSKQLRNLIRNGKIYSMNMEALMICMMNIIKS